MRLSFARSEAIDPSEVGVSSEASTVVDSVSVLVTNVGLSSKPLSSRILRLREWGSVIAFINAGIYTKVRLWFPIPLIFDPNKCGAGSGEIRIRKSTKVGDIVEVFTMTPMTSPGFQRILSDEDLCKSLLAMRQRDLWHLGSAIILEYEKKNDFVLGKVEFDLTNDHKKWRKEIEADFSPQDFVVELMIALNKIITHVREDLNPLSSSTPIVLMAPPLSVMPKSVKPPGILQDAETLGTSGATASKAFSSSLARVIATIRAASGQTSTPTVSTPSEKLSSEVTSSDIGRFIIVVSKKDSVTHTAKYCIRCKARLDSDSSYCSRCGQKQPQ